MNIELKSLRIYDRMSDETTAFTASLYINGKGVGTAKNDGQGGCTFYHADHPDFFPIIEEAEAYCESLPPTVYDSFSIPMNLENYIDDLVMKAAEEKELKRFKKAMETHQKTAILIGTETEYKQIFWSKKGSKAKIPLAEILSRPDGNMQVKACIMQQKKKMKPEERILNTNIPAELL